METPSAADSMPLVVLGHGTRHPIGNRQFLRTVQHIAERLPDTLVLHALLEADRQDLVSTLAQVADQGFRRICVAPMLLLAAGHLRRDLPAILARFRATYPHVQVHVLPALGSHSQIIQHHSQSVIGMLTDVGGQLQDTLLLMVGRGSWDGESNVQFEEIAQRVATDVGMARWTTAYLAMAEPRLRSALEEAANQPLLWVVVQPHLLFEGELNRGFCRTMNKIREQEGRFWRQRLLQGKPLGGGACVALAVADRYRLVQEQGHW